MENELEVINLTYKRPGSKRPEYTSSFNPCWILPPLQSSFIYWDSVIEAGSRNKVKKK